MSRAREEVVRALGRLERGERNALDDVREALCPLIAELRAAGSPFDAIVDAVRTLVATPTNPEGARSLLPAAREALVELSTQWCAAEYAREVPGDPAGDRDGELTREPRDSSPRDL